MLPAHYNKTDKPSYFCRFTFGQFFTLLVLEIFTLFFIFYLGARYGRSLLGIETPTAAVEPSGLPEVKTTDPNVVATTNDPEIKELAQDILKSAPTPDLKERVAEMLREGERGTTDHGPRTTDRKTKTEEPHKIITPPPVVQTAPKDAKFALQVGSYANPDEAHLWVSRWKQKGYPAYLVSADIPGKGRWYRVRLGGFDSKSAAKVYLKEFKAKEKVEAFVASGR